MAKTYGVTIFSFSKSCAEKIIEFDNFEKAKAFFDEVVRKKSYDLGEPKYIDDEHEFTKLPYAEWESGNFDNFEFIELKYTEWKNSRKKEGKVIVQIVEILPKEEGKNHFLMDF